MRISLQTPIEDLPWNLCKIAKCHTGWLQSPCATPPTRSETTKSPNAALAIQSIET